MKHQDPKQPTDSSVNRRAFFRQIIYRGLDNAEKAGKNLGQRFKNAIPQVSPPPKNVPLHRPTYLRPPGAVDESIFNNTCDRTGQCAAACPANCIIIDPDTLHGTPHIIAKQSPCVMCDSLACMDACPTGALKPTERNNIQMGLAKVHQVYCLRTRGEDCRLCITQCPVGQFALAIDQNDRIQVRDACTGCGVCERACPTQPPAIEITPLTDLTLST